MSEVLTQLWNGQLCPIEDRCDRDAQIQDLWRLISENKERLSRNLAEQQKEILEEYDDVMCEILSLAEENSFIKGFRLAVKFMVDALQ